MDDNGSHSREEAHFTGRRNLLPVQTAYSEIAPEENRYGQSGYSYTQDPLLSSTSVTRSSVGPSMAQAESFPIVYGHSGQHVGSGWQPGSLQQSLPYSSNVERGQQESQRYGQGTFYNVSSQAALHGPQSRFGLSQQYSERTSSLIGDTTTPYGFQQYYMGGDGGILRNPATSPSQIHSQGVPTYQALPNPQQNEGTSHALSSGTFETVMGESSQPTSHSAYGTVQPTYGNQATQSVPDYDNTYDAYQTELKKTYGFIEEGRIDEASRNLLVISKWLLENVEALGLAQDDEALHSQRLALWEEFNNCWLATLQTQKEMIQELLENGQNPQYSDSVTSYDFLEEMGKELVRLCDGLEKFGLVDYQLGVWEEQIIIVLTQCLDLFATSFQQQP